MRCTKASDAGGQPYAAYVLVCAFLLAGAALCGCSTAPIDTDGVEAAASDDALPSADAVGDGYLGDGYLGDDAGRARADAGAADSAGSDAGVATDVGDDDGSDGDGSVDDGSVDDGSAGDGSAGDGADDADNPSDVGDGAAKPAIATIFVIPEAPVTANVTVVDKGNWAIALPLFGAEILAYRVEKGAAVIAQLGPLAGQVTPQSGTLSAPNAAVVVAGARLLRHGDGIAALVGATWLPSPLATALPGAVVAWRKGAGSAEVWLVAGGALHVWRSGVLATVPGLKLVGVPALAYGCHTPAGPGVWVAHQSGVVAVHVDTAGDAQVFAIAKADVVDGLVCDVNGRLWVAADGGLVSRGIDGTFTAWALGGVVDRLLGVDGAGGFWLHRDGVPWRVDGEVFRPVLGMPTASTWTVDDSDGLVSATAEGVVRILTAPPPPKQKVGWLSDIAQIYDESCALCHSPTGVSTKLATAKNWHDNYEKILQYVEAGVMPLKPVPKLSSAAIAIIKNWKTDGFQP